MDKYFHGTTELKAIWPIPKEELSKKFPGYTGPVKRNDGYSVLVGADELGDLYPVTRIIYFKKNPSLHKCDGRCRSAKGPNCECSCRGVYHGAGG